MIEIDPRAEALEATAQAAVAATVSAPTSFTPAMLSAWSRRLYMIRNGIHPGFSGRMPGGLGLPQQCRTRELRRLTWFPVVLSFGPDSF